MILVSQLLSALLQLLVLTAVPLVWYLVSARRGASSTAVASTPRRISCPLL